MSDIFTSFGEDSTKSMSREEKKEFIRKLIHEEQPGTKAAFFNPSTGEMVNLREFVNEVGEEEAIEKIVDAIGNADTQSICVTQDQVHELLEKFKRGECSDEELSVLKMIVSSITSSDNSQFVQHVMSVIINIVKFAQEDIHYNPTLADLFSVIDMLTTVDVVHDEKLETHKYQQSGPAILTEISSNIGDDIMNTWRASCSEVPADELVVLGLISAIRKILVKADIELLSADTFLNILGLDDLDDSSDDTENGSNTEDNSKSGDSDEDMRNLLRD